MLMRWLTSLVYQDTILISERLKVRPCFPFSCYVIERFILVLLNYHARLEMLERPEGLSRTYSHAFCYSIVLNMSLLHSFSIFDGPTI
jgi:hypothetical protein